MMGYGAYHRRASKPIEVQGQEFPSRAAAARAFGVSPSAIYHAVREGRTVFIRNRQPRPRKPRKSRRKMGAITFAKHQPLPPGYRVEWWEQDEQYHWIISEDVYSEGCSDRWAAWRGAWAHYRAQRSET